MAATVTFKSASGDRWTEDRPPRSERERRRALVYDPYHAMLASLLLRKRMRFGFAVLLSAHSFSPSTDHQIADLVIGTRNRTSAGGRWIDGVQTIACEHGLSVAHDLPFEGGYTTSTYGDPADHMHAIQIEIARSRYMDTTSLTPLADAFKKTRAFSSALVQALVAANVPPFRCSFAADE